MYEIAISKYYEATVVIQQTIHMAKDTDPSNLMQPKARTSTIEMLNKARDSMSGLHVPVTKLALDELRERLSWFKQEMPYYACGALLLSLSETMRRELQTVKVFGLAHIIREAVRNTKTQRPRSC